MTAPVTLFPAEVVSGKATLASVHSGAGQPVVFLHANVCDSRMWHEQMREVARTHQAIAYDRRGFGATRAEAEDHSPVADLLAVIGAAGGAGQAVLVGCSQGGKIAIDAALRHPSRVCGLVLIAPSVGGAPDAVNPPEITDLLARQNQVEQAGDPDEIAALKARLWLDGPLAPEGRVGGPPRALFAAMSGIALRSPPVGRSLDTGPAYARLAEIAVPVLVLWGTLDFPHIRERSRWIANTVRHGTGRELVGVAHLPSLEQPDAVTRLVADFVRAIAPASSASPPA